jgi:hypothetical protein
LTVTHEKIVIEMYICTTADVSLKLSGGTEEMRAAGKHFTDT